MPTNLYTIEYNSSAHTIKSDRESIVDTNSNKKNNKPGTATFEKIGRPQNLGNPKQEWSSDPMAELLAYIAEQPGNRLIDLDRH